MTGFSLGIVCEDLVLRQAIATRLPRSLAVRFITSEAYLNAARHGDIRPTLVDEQLCSPEFRAAVVRNTQLGVPAPIVFVRANAPLGRRGWIERSVPQNEWRRRGWSQVRGEICRSLRAAATSAARDSGEQSPCAEEIVEALFSDDPPHSVVELAKRIGTSRDAVYASWNRAMGNEYLRLGEFVRLALLLTVVERKHAKIGWRRLWAQQLRGRPDRGRRVAAKVFGASLDELCQERFWELIALVEDVVTKAFAIGTTEFWQRREQSRWQ